MDGDGGAENEPLSLIVIPPASTADADAGAILVNQIPSSDSPFPSTSHSRNLSITSSNTPSNFQPSSEAEKSAQNDPVAPRNNDSKPQSDLVQIEIVKAEDAGMDLNGQVELIENSSDGMAGSSDSVGSSGDDGQEWGPDNDHEMKRVKVYELVGSRWLDQGTAFCFGHFSQDGTEALLTARSERNFQDIILSTTIRSNDVYQRQQDTLIVWTEPDGVDYALSFQDPDGCAEVWNFILEVQRHMNGGGEDQGPIGIGTSSPLIGPEPASVTTQSILRSGHLPTPQLGIISDIERAIKGLARTQAMKEKICEYIQAEDYIKQMIDVMHVAEDVETLDSLHALCTLMQTILMLNDHSMYEHILEDELFFGVIGMLEYDPEFPHHKANYREFLNQNSHFHQPIVIRDPVIQRKIHHTYRLQFLKDVVLARALDDSTFNVLNSCIIFNQIDIITHIQQDPTFLREVVSLYVDQDMLSGGGRKTAPSPSPQQLPVGLNGKGGEPTSPEMGSKASTSPQPPNGASPSPNDQSPSLSSSPTKSVSSFTFAPLDELSEDGLTVRREVILLIQQLCAMGKGVQLPARMALFRSLVDRGILFAVQWALGLSEKESSSRPMISAGGEILAALLDHDLNGVRGHVLKQVVAIDKERQAGKKGADKAETIVEMACRILAQSKDLGIQSQVGDALKGWLDLPLRGDSAGALAAAKFGPRTDDPGTERFMDYFYKDCITIMFKPFGDLQEWRNFTESILQLTREQTNRYVYLCDLLYNFTLQHSHRSHFFIMSSNVIVRVATLMKARDKHLRHAAFRFFRLLLKQNNANVQGQIVKHDIIKPILDLTIQESRRDNLLSCSCQEYFEHIRRDNMKDMIKFCMTKHESEIKTLAASPLGGERFKLFIRRWEQNNEPFPMEDSAQEKLMDTRGWPGQGRALDAEEEDYFNADDDDDDLIPSISQQYSRGMGTSSPLPSLNNLKRKRRLGLGNASKNFRTQNHPPLRSPLLNQLVDYDEDDEDDLKSIELKPVLAPEGSSTTHTIELASSPDLPRRQPPSQTPASSSSSSSSSSLSNGPPPKRPVEDDDDEDNLLESLVRSRPQSPAPGMMASMTLEPMRRSEKRRRGEEEEDDELMERLAKSKRADVGAQKEGVIGVSGRTKPGDDPPKKFKVKFGSSASSSVGAAPAAAAATSPAPTNPVPSETGAKDGDTG